MENWERDIIRESSIPLSDGGDTHIHIWGPKENDFTITTRIPLGDGLVWEDHDNIKW